MLTSTQAILRCCVVLSLSAVAFGEALAPAPSAVIPQADRGLCSSQEGLQKLLQDAIDKQVDLPEVQLDRADASSLSAVSTVREFYAELCTSAGLAIVPLPGPLAVS